MSIFIILITYVVIALPGTRGLYAIEGEEVELLFTYPCESTLITLRLNNRAPFYTSANPETTQLPPNYVVTNQKDTRHGDNCTLYLTINPVSRDDEGTFILMPYTDDIASPFMRIRLEVLYPPGKASCESRKYFGKEWVSLDCTAPKGSIPGQIVCYQSGNRIPPSTEPTENDRTLTQNLLARVLEDHVYCCSSTLKQIKDRCECKDWEWDPVHNMILTTHTDPCPSILPSDSTQSYNPSDPLSNSHISSSSGLLIPIQTNKDNPNTRSSSVGIYVPIIGSSGLFVVLLLIAKIFCGQFSSVQKERKDKSKTERSQDDITTIKRTESASSPCSNTSESTRLNDYQLTGTENWSGEFDKTNPLLSESAINSPSDRPSNIERPVVHVQMEDEIEPLNSSQSTIKSFNRSSIQNTERHVQSGGFNKTEPLILFESDISSPFDRSSIQNTEILMNQFQFAAL